MPLEEDLTYKTVTIRKKNGKLRKISKPSNYLKQLQQSKLPELNNIFNLTPNSRFFYGFIQGRSPVDAAIMHSNSDVCVQMDISNFFDSVTYDMLKSANMPLYDLDEYWMCFHKDGYLAQGFPTSPILATMYLQKYIDNLIVDLYDNIKYSTIVTIYADDIQISFVNGELSNDMTKDDIKTTVKQIKAAVTNWLESIGLKTNTAKTRVHYSNGGYMRILGCNVRNGEVRATRKTMNKIRRAKYKQETSSLNGLISWKNYINTRSK